MTREEAVALLKFRLSNVQGSRLDAGIILELQQAQKKLERAAVLPFFLRRWMEYTDYPADASYIPLPDDFLRFEDDVPYPMWRADAPPSGGWNPLARVGTFEGMGMRETVDAGVPRRFALQNGNIYFFPPPNGSFSYRLFYLGTEPALVSDAATNGWLTHYSDLLVDTAGLRVAQMARDAGAVQLFSAAVADDIAAMQMNEIAREVNGRFYTFQPEDCAPRIARYPDAYISD